MIVWTPAVLSVFNACILYFCISICSVQLSMFHMERPTWNKLIIIIITYYYYNDLSPDNGTVNNNQKLLVE